MIQHLDGYVLKKPLSNNVLQSIEGVHGVLNNPISEHSLNIVGTSFPYDGVQIYGWKSPIAKHKDNTGFILFMPLSIVAGSDEIVSEDSSVSLKVGHIYLLDDTKEHYTVGDGNVVALFFGSFKESELCDQLYSAVFDQFESYVQ